MNSLFPPILDSSQPAFVWNGRYNIIFSISNFNNIDTINHVQIKIVNLSTNQSIVNTSIFPDGIIYQDYTIEELKQSYSISISSNQLIDSGIKPGQYYKIQLRFGKNKIWENLSDFYTWKNEQISTNSFSEWSTVMTIKAIDQPKIIILNNEIIQNNNLNNFNTQNAEFTLTPLFVGQYSCNTYEPIDKYKFNLYDEFNNLIESSDWLQHDLSNDISDADNININVDKYKFNTVLENNTVYKVQYLIKTINLYEGYSDPYIFITNKSLLNPIDNISFICKDNMSGNYPISDEEACIDLYIQTNDEITGNYIIIRSSEKSNFNEWIDLTYLTYLQETFPEETLIFRDYSIESGVKYKYGIQKENSLNIRTSPLYDETLRQSNFEHSYLLSNGIQLKLNYDNLINSFKHTQFVSKQDTIGSKYPFIIKNGDSYYAEFTISGLITFNSNDNNTFLQKKEDGYYYLDDLIIPKDKYTDKQDNIYTFNTNLSNNNYYIERKFRECVENFLNNNNLKLYKSRTEGNILISLMNVSLTPKAQLGRLIYNFSATAYEIDEYNFENLKKYKIINYQSYKYDDIAKTDIDTFGQISALINGIYTRNKDVWGIDEESQPQNIIDLIKENVNYNIDNQYKYNFQKLTSIIIEPYPKINIDNQINTLKYKKSIIDNIEEINNIDKEIEYLERLKDEIDLISPNTKIAFQINGKEINFGLNKKYSLEDLNLDSNNKIYLKYTIPIIINYTCTVNIVEILENTISASTQSKVWNQIYGIFTNTEEYIKQYNLYNMTNIKLYSTLDIYKAIKDKVKNEIEDNYNTKFNLYDEKNNEWTNGENIYYQFKTIEYFSIEAKQNCFFEIIYNNNLKKQFALGPTERLTFKFSEEDNIKSITLMEPSYILVDYICYTNQMLKGKPIINEGVISYV